MAFIRHIAITSPDPAKAAEFYKKHFGMKELYRKPDESASRGVWLTDGWIYVAIVKNTDFMPKLGPEQSSDYYGIHHIGFMVDNQKAKIEELLADGVQHVKEHPDAPPHPLLSRPEAGGAVNEKIIGPDWVHLDVRDRGWNEVIRANATLYELKPAQA